MFDTLKINKLARLTIWIILAVLFPISIFILITGKTILVEWTVLSIVSTPVTLTLIADPTGIVFSCVVILISANVLQFSTIYIKEDKFIDRFTVLVILFVASINILIYIPHLIILLLGWDGLGLVSFILVIYYQNPKSLAAGIITALTNRIGDAILLISIAWALNQGHWNILHIWQSNESMYISLAILLAAITKRAQIPFSRWLPAAMAAPTPVSALVHSSTLVTAGVFLLIRFYPFLRRIWWFNKALLLLATLTTTIAGLRAITECDIKKIIALSTLRQLGVIITAIGLGMVGLAYFHIVTHALFKALLFICAGTLIHSHIHSQDLRWIGNITFQIPTTSSCFALANMALCGIPFMSGFYSKDIIIESSIFYNNNLPIILIIIFSVALTSFYSARFRINTIWGPINGVPFIHLEESKSLTIPIIVLTLMSITSGSAILWLTASNQESIITTPVIKIIPIIMVTLGLITAWIIRSSNIVHKSNIILIPLTHAASCTMWFLVPLSSQFIIKQPIYIAHNYLKSLDQSWLEMLGGQGARNYSSYVSNNIIKSFNTTPVNFLLMSAILTMLAIIYLYLGSLYKTYPWRGYKGSSPK
jgi:NADH-ubiquinone oxidoreductase chain 5